MASIERTAYPRFKRNPTLKELRDIYSVTPEENQFAHRIARGAVPVLSLLIMLKSFQRLGYFPRPKDIPDGVINHIRACLNLSKDMETNFQGKLIYRHQKAIRDYLNVHPYDKEALHIATAAIHKAAQVMDNPADLINVAIEELIKERCELPAFSTLDRLVRRIRTLVNYRLFNIVISRLSPECQQKLDQLLETSDRKRSTEYCYLKILLSKRNSKSPTLSHMKDIQDKLSWLANFISGVDRLLDGIPNAKIKHFAAEARVLDASELKDFTPPKRYTLMLCMIYRSQVLTRDNLVEMFLKRIGIIHNKGKEELELIREQHRSKTENLILVLAEVLEATSINEDDAATGKKVKVVAAEIPR